MSTNPARSQYSQQDENQYRERVDRELQRCVKKDEERNAVRDVFTDTVTGTRYQVTIVSGVWTLTAL